jgi:3-dehydroquinate synthase
VTDSNAGPQYLKALVHALNDADIETQTVTLAAGESSKSFETLHNLLEMVLAYQPERKTSLIALGGGVIGDITGFAASQLLRGLPFIQIPTTLLAQVDSSVGGKTAINSVHGKNLIGSFYQPRCVLADTAVLDSLPKRQLLAGYAEVIKYGLINDPEFFAWCESNGKDLLAGDEKARAHAVYTSCAAKADIVAQDEREGGIRALLNLGHTFGHALEKAVGYSDTLLHGEAVALGCLMAAHMSAEKGLCPPEVVIRLADHWRAVGLPTRCPDAIAGVSPETLAGYCFQDKKVADGKLTFILMRDIGKAFISLGVTVNEVEHTFRVFSE